MGHGGAQAEEPAGERLPPGVCVQAGMTQLPLVIACSVNDCQINSHYSDVSQRLT